VWILVGLSAALFGAAPRAVAGAWVALAAVVFVELFGTLLDLPSWLIDLSPYGHAPNVPAGDLTIGPLLVMTGLAAVLGSVGLAGFRRRDIG